MLWKQWGDELWSLQHALKWRGGKIQPFKVGNLKQEPKQWSMSLNWLNVSAQQPTVHERSMRKWVLGSILGFLLLHYLTTSLWMWNELQPSVHFPVVSARAGCHMLHWINCVVIEVYVISWFCNWKNNPLLLIMAGKANTWPETEKPVTLWAQFCPLKSNS